MDDRRAFLKGTTVDCWQPRPDTQSHSRLPGVVGAAASQLGAQEQELFWGPRCDAFRPGTLQNASRLGLALAQQSPLTARRPITHPGDLVARALEILTEEHEAWQARSPRSIR